MKRNIFSVFDTIILKEYYKYKNFKSQYIFHSTTTDVGEILEIKNILLKIFPDYKFQQNTFDSSSIMELINGFKISAKDDIYLKWEFDNFEIYYQYKVTPKNQLSFFINFY